jgi:hypothetical protein
MTVNPELWEQVRVRANFACEYCGVTETDTAGQLTVDHFQPRAFQGSDELENLLYCCLRCNVYKADYWPTQTSDPILWNPRREPVETHLRSLVDGNMHALTPTGQFTIRRLRLHQQHASLLEDYRALLQEQQTLLKLLLRGT